MKIFLFMINFRKKLKLGKSFLESKLHPLPIWVHLWITDKCNLSCDYCYVVDNKSADPTTDEVKSWITHADNLGSAIVGYDGFAVHGFSVSAIFDNDTTKIGKKVGKHKVGDIKSLKKVIKEKKITIGVIAVPAVEAQNIANLLVGAGVKIVLNYTPVTVMVPDMVKVHNTNPVKELLYTLYFLSKKSDDKV